MRQKALFCEAVDVVFTRGFRIYGGFALPLPWVLLLAKPPPAENRNIEENKVLNIFTLNLTDTT